MKKEIKGKRFSEVESLTAETDAEAGDLLKQVGQYDGEKYVLGQQFTVNVKTPQYQEG
ncbi:MAG: hypothetical protein R6U27_10535 [Desulfobacterales bacterium]